MIEKPINDVESCLKFAVYRIITARSLLKDPSMLSILYEKRGYYTSNFVLN